MTTNKTTPKELWARQQISGPDVDYDLWNKHGEHVDGEVRQIHNEEKNIRASVLTNESELYFYS